MFVKTAQNLHDGITDTSAVTTPSKPRLDRAPRIIPQENAKYYREKTNRDKTTRDKNVINLKTCGRMCHIGINLNIINRFLL